MPGEPADVCAFVLPGLGHYHPIASVLLGLPHRTAAVAAQVDIDSPLAGRVGEDGFAFHRWPAEVEPHRLDRQLRAAARVLRTRVAPGLARRGGRPTPLPSLAARSAFAAGTQLLPIAHPRLAAGAAIAAVLDEVRPRLVLTEYDSPWFEVLTAERGIPLVRYSTGPVGTMARGRPITPLGLRPSRPGLERPVNAVNLRARRLRQRRADAIFRRARSASTAPAPSDRAPVPPIASISFSSALLDDYPSCPPHGSTYVGAPLYRHPTGTPTVDRRRDTVLVTWGSSPEADLADVMARLAAALAEAAPGTRLVVQSDDDRVRRAFEEHHPGVEFLGPTAAPPYAEFERARLVIGHGGYGTIVESVVHRAPVLTIPQLVADRMETGQRILTAGVGATLDRYRFTAGEATAVITRLLGDPQVARNLEAVGADLADRGPWTDLLARLEGALTG